MLTNTHDREYLLTFLGSSATSSGVLGLATDVKNAPAEVDHIPPVHIDTAPLNSKIW